MSDHFPKLFSPLRIGPVTAPNRVVMGAHVTGFAEPSRVWGEPGLWSERQGRYLRDRARGGVGTLIVGQAHVHPSTAYQLPNGGAAWKPESVAHFRRVTGPIHEHGALAFIQLSHNGAKAGTGDWSKLPLLSPSAAAVVAEVPKVMEREEITEIIEGFATSAAHAVAGGFDGIEIHGAHDYLVTQFLSPMLNHRTDEYGGSFENRLRFVAELLGAVREAVGPTVAVGLRLVGDQLDPEGRGVTAELAGDIARALERRGLADFFNVSVGSAGTMVQPVYAPPMFGVYAATAVKKAVERTPVFAVHRILTPGDAEGILARGEADAITLVRPLIADPEWAEKARTGEAHTIRKCTGCNQQCYGNLMKSLPVSCVTNPAVGRDADLGPGTLTPAASPGRVVVVGGGPAGLEAAWVAAARGHRVTLLEREQRLGGMIRLAAELPGRAEIGDFADWRAGECERRGVEIRLGVQADPATVLALRPDAVIVATGGTPRVDISSAYQPMPLSVSGDVRIVDHVHAMRDPDILGARVLVIDLVGHIEGAGLAELAAAAGRQVTLITAAPTLTQLDPATAMGALRRATAAGVAWCPSTVAVGVEDGHAVLRDVISGRIRRLAVDTVIVRGHGKPVDDLFHSLRGQVTRVLRVGDAVAVRTADRAIYDGHLAGRTV